MRFARWVLIWTGVLAVPILAAGLALASPLLAWRDPVYVAAGFAGVVGLGLMLLQPLLMGGVLPGLPAARGRRVHRWVGALLVSAVLVHVAGLWITSPPDVVDALLFRSPTPFSAWGVIAMWAVFGAALLALFRRRVQLWVWRLAHTGLICAAVIGTSVHALQIQGTMEPVSRAVLCLLVVLVTAWIVVDRRAWARWAPARHR